MSQRIVGTPAQRTDAQAKVTGIATCVPDIVLPRMLHAAVVRAGVPHAVIRGIDTAAAGEMPGVHAIVTGAGCTMLFGTVLRDQPPIAVERVRHAGKAVAVVLAGMFGVPSAKVRVHVPYLGGGFGGKSDVSIEPLLAYAASFVPAHAVRLVLSRREVFTSSLLGRGMQGRMKLGATRAGDLVALEAEMYFADGAYGDTGWPVCTVAGHNCAGPYHVSVAAVDVYGVYTNSPPVGAYRGYGHPEGQFMMGRLMDMLARKLVGRGRRRRGAPCRTATPSLRPRDRGSCQVAQDGAVCVVRVSPDGGRRRDGLHQPRGDRVGQGSQTVFAQMAGEALGLPMERVRVCDDVDTQNAPWDSQTVASMQTCRGGRAILDACGKAVRIARENAALVFGCDPAEVVFRDGACRRGADAGRPAGRGGGRAAAGVPAPESLTLAQLARGYSYENGLTVGIPIETVGTYRVAGVVEPDPETGTGNAAGSWTFGVERAQVRVDTKTGEVTVLHFAVALDPGRVINPQTARGQVTGAVVQGLGATLLEEIRFKQDGTIRNAKFGCGGRAVRLLHPGPYHETVCPACGTARRLGRGDCRGDRAQHLPLHGVRDHRGGRQGCPGRHEHGGSARMSDGNQGGTTTAEILSRTFVQLGPGVVSDPDALRRALDAVARPGLGGAELNIVNPDEFDLDALAAELSARGLAMSAYATGGDANAHGLSISTPDDGLRRRSVERCLRYVEVAARFGSSIILGFMKGGPGGDVATRRQLLVESLREIAPAAEAAGVIVQLEATNHYEAACAVTVAEGVALADQSGSAAVRVLPDTYHMNIEEPDTVASLVRFKGRYVNVHLSDNNRYFPGFGGISFSPVFAALAALEYDGTFGIEGRPHGSLEDDLARAVSCLSEAAERAAASGLAGR